MKEFNNLSIRRNKKYSVLIDILVQDKSKPQSIGVFQYIKHLCNFAATIGLYYNEVEEVEAENDEITLMTYMGGDDDNIIYLSSVFLNKNIEKLKDDNFEDCIREFEKYINGGFYCIQKWLEKEAPSSYVDVLIEKIIAIENEGKPKNEVSETGLDLEFEI